MPTWKKVLIWAGIIWVCVTAPTVVALVVNGGIHLLGQLGHSLSVIGRSVRP
jgi:hypothetical protein